MSANPDRARYSLVPTVHQLEIEMKRILLATLLGAAALSANAADVGVSINVGEPGFYGSINIGSAPPPQVINAQPIIVAPAPGPVLAPIYMHVPLEHQRDWRRYCGMYNACGRPVLFVRDDWYSRVYVPHYRAHIDEYRRAEPRHEEVRHDEHRDDRHEHDHDRDH
jgi:hypothetical protein